jgi:hypothetical protein
MENKERPSPSSSATLYKTGTIKTGNDGNKWIIVENKNGVKRWQLYKKSSKISSKKSSKILSKISSKKPSKKSSKTPPKKPSKKSKKPRRFRNSSPYSLKSMFELKTVVKQKRLEKIISSNKVVNEIYTTLQNKIIPELNKLGIKTYIVPLPLSVNNMYWTDYAPEYIYETYGDRLLDKYIYFVFYLNKEGNELHMTRPIGISFTPLGKNKKTVVELFTSNLKKYFEWSGSINDQMLIFYE